MMRRVCPSWAKQFGGAGYDEGNSIAIDGAGAVYITGDYGLSVDFDANGGGAVLNALGSQDIYLNKLTANGDYVWAQSFGGTGYDIPYYLTIDASFNIYTTGSFGSTGADFDPYAGTTGFNSVNQDIYVQKLNQSVSLPVQLLGFGADLVQDKVLLHWQTTGEQNTDRYEMERGSDAQHFTKINTVKALKQPVQTNNYSITDDSPLADVGYYRLKIVDLDGSSAYSSVAKVHNTALQHHFRLLQNPVVNDVVVNVTGLHEKSRAMVLDLTGKIVVAEQEVNLENGLNFTIHVKHLSAGMYILKLANTGGTAAISFVRQ